MVKPSEVFKSKREIHSIKLEHEREDGTKIEIDWKVRALTPRLLVKNFEYFAALEDVDFEETDEKKMTTKQRASLIKKLDPLIDVVLPFSCVDPKVVFEGESNDSQINIEDLPLDILMKLFGEIFKVSGMTKEAQEQRELLKKVPTPSLSPPSA